MSHHKTDSPEEAKDPFLPFSPEDVTTLFDQGSLDKDSLYGSYEHPPSYTPSSTGCPQFFDDFNIDSPFSPAGTPPPSSGSDLSSPDLSGPTFDSEPHTPPLPSPYPPMPASATPHSYPLQLQQAPGYSLTPPGSYQLPNTHSTPAHGHFTSSVLAYSASRVNPPSHRRSLSQSDADRIAAAFKKNNTTAPPVRRAISATPDNGPRGIPRLNPYHKGVKQGQGHKKRRSNPPTSAPLPMQVSVLGGQNPGFSRTYTTIGTPLPERVRESFVDSEICEAKSETGIRMQLNGPRLKYMSHEEQMRDSARVLEMGAMAVVAKNAGQRLIDEKGENGTQGDTDVLKLVDQMESQLKLQEVGDTAKGLRGCEMIREALNDNDHITGTVEKGEMQTDTGEDTQENAEVKKKFIYMTSVADEVHKADSDTFVSADGQDLLTLLQNDLSAHGYGVHKD